MPHRRGTGDTRSGCDAANGTRTSCGGASGGATDKRRERAGAGASEPARVSRAACAARVAWWWCRALRLLCGSPSLVTPDTQNFI